MTTTTNPTTPAVNGIVAGQPCWLVRAGRACLPRYCESVPMVARFGQTWVVVTDGQVWDDGEVFASEAEARAKALESARWYAAHYAREAVDAAEVVGQLEAK